MVFKYVEVTSSPVSASDKIQEAPCIMKTEERC